MRIAVVHSFYSSAQPSGENAVVLAEVDALRRAGHEVELFAAHTDELEQQPLYNLRAAVRVASGRGASPLDALRGFGPDVVHVHNLFPNFGTAWVKDLEAPLVVTLHNFRPLCAAYTLYRDGHECTDCVTRSWPSLLHGCYRGSRTATLPLTISLRGGASRNPVLQRADRILVFTNFARELYAGAGIAECRIEVISNFVPESLAGLPGPGGAGWLYAGRLSEEKGILDLVRQWPSDISLTVVGSGEQESLIRAAAAGKAISMLGPLTRAEVTARMRMADGVVFPSVCREGFPLVYAESLAAGTPLLAFKGSSVAELVQADGTGAVLDWGDDIPAGLEQLFEIDRAHCRLTFSASYSERSFVQRARSTYEAAVAG